VTTELIQDSHLKFNDAPVRRATLLPDPEPREVLNLFISVDDHVIEPPDMFEGRFPKHLADQAPRIVDYNGVPGWKIENRHLPNLGLNAVAGRPPEEWDDEPRQWDEMRPGCWQVDARIHDMDLNGVYASMCFPSRVAGFGGARFSEIENPELGLACVRAWNDWHYEEWASKYPERLIPLQVPWLNDPVVAAEEIRRNAERGFKSVTFLADPTLLGRPPFWTDYWDPFFAACEETDTIISCHIGSGGGRPQPVLSPEAAAIVEAQRTDWNPKMAGAVSIATTLLQGITTSVEWVYAGVFGRFPGLKVTLAECGGGWVPAILDRLDYMGGHAGHAVAGAWRDKEMKPAEVFLRNFYFCIFDDHAAIEMRHRIGVENLLLEVDYPHGDGTWPDTQIVAYDLLKGVPEDEVRKITHENAAKLFRHPLPAERPVTVNPG
jgi:predicted TIM-barrel fold metal-dependent hydrolase